MKCNDNKIEVVNGDGDIILCLDPINNCNTHLKNSDDDLECTEC